VGGLSTWQPAVDFQLNIISHKQSERATDWRSSIHIHVHVRSSTISQSASAKRPEKPEIGDEKSRLPVLLRRICGRDVRKWQMKTHTNGKLISRRAWLTWKPKVEDHAHHLPPPFLLTSSGNATQCYRWHERGAKTGEHIEQKVLKQIYRSL